MPTDVSGLTFVRWQSPGANCELLPSAIAEYEFPDGSFWRAHPDHFTRAVPAKQWEMAISDKYGTAAKLQI